MFMAIFNSKLLDYQRVSIYKPFSGRVTTKIFNNQGDMTGQAVEILKEDWIMFDMDRQFVRRLFRRLFRRAFSGVGRGLGKLQRPHCDLTRNHGFYRGIIPLYGLTSG